MGNVLNPTRLTHHLQIRWGEYDPGDPSRESLTEYLDWVLEHTGLAKTDPVWLCRVGSMYRILDYFEPALDAFKESENQLGDNWIVLLQIGETYAGLKQFTPALEYLHKVKAKHSELIDTDQNFKDVYWDRVLLPEGNLHRELKDNAAAIRCYQDILAQDAAQAGDYHANALAALFALWIEIGDSDSILAFLRNKKAESKLNYWLGNIVGSRDDVHDNIIKAARQLSAVEEVSQMYEEVIEPVTEPNNDEKDDGVESKESSEDLGVPLNNLRFFQAILRFHASQLDHEHEKALQAWEKMVLNPISGQDYWVAYKARRLLARSLLDKGASDPTAGSYVTRLETLCRSNEECIRGYRQSQHDPSICLARLHLLKDNQKSADEEARRLLRGAFDNWPEDLSDPSLRMRFALLAQILAIFNMDEDAVAAWQALQPRQADQTATEEDDASSQSKVDSPQEPPADPTDDAPVEALAPASVSGAEAYISGYLCDGCGTEWDKMLADCWDCKHCLCVQLCTPCHDKLLADEISPLVCSKEHNFLYLPKFDEEKWSSLPDDSIVVAGKAVKREEWLNQFRERWLVKQEHIDAYKLETARELKNTMSIVKYALKWKRRSQKKVKRARTFPILNGA